MSKLLEKRDILMQAKAIILCGLPYRRIKETRITRRAQLGPSTRISVTYAAVGDGTELAYGGDRALLSWIQTRAYPSGVVSFDSVMEFLRAFELSASGTHYEKFQQRLERIKALSIRVQIDAADEEAGLSATPIKRYYTPKSKDEIRRRVQQEMSGQLPLMKAKPYCFQLDEDFMAYFRDNPVPMPLPLMRQFMSNCLKWDLAQLILWRCAAARRPSLFPWEELVSQLGTNDSNRYRLAAKFAETFSDVRRYYKDFPAVVMDDFSGVMVDQWEPPYWQRAASDARTFR